MTLLFNLHLYTFAKQSLWPLHAEVMLRPCKSCPVTLLVYVNKLISAGSATVVDTSAASWQGAAPDARLAFQDLGQGREGSLAVPPNVAIDYLPYSYAWWVPPVFLLVRYIDTYLPR
jgi:hypothetical protein